MNDRTQSVLDLAPGTPFEGGFFAGLIRINDQPFALIRAPKARGQHDDVAWNDSYARVENAESHCDGLSNTIAMAKAGSAIAKWARGQVINDLNDWYIPAQDELEICYRALKPTTETNSLWARSGINVSALTPTYPYRVNSPAQTAAEAFQDGGEEAFDDTWYWCSTQLAGGDDYAWMQSFGGGGQYYDHKDSQYRVVLVRRVPL